MVTAFTYSPYKVSKVSEFMNSAHSSYSLVTFHDFCTNLEAITCSTACEGRITCYKMIYKIFALYLICATQAWAHALIVRVCVCVCVCVCVRACACARASVCTDAHKRGLVSVKRDKVIRKSRTCLRQSPSTMASSG